MSNAIQQFLTLRRDGVVLVLDDACRVVHWGADPGQLPASADFGLSALPLLPTQHDGWAGRPAVTGHREGGFPHLRLSTTSIDVDDDRLTVNMRDADAGVEIETMVRLTEQGIVKMRHALRNIGDGAWTVGGLRCVLPIPDDAVEWLDFTGRWALERVPQRGKLRFGNHSRENRRGRTGHDSTTILSMGTKGFAHRAGQVWSVHVGWSGNHEHSAERVPDSVGALGGAELLEPGEVRLRPGLATGMSTKPFGHKDFTRSSSTSGSAACSSGCGSNRRW